MYYICVSNQAIRLACKDLQIMTKNIHTRINAKANHVNRIKAYGYYYFGERMVMTDTCDINGNPYHSDLYAYQFRKDKPRYYN